MARKTRLHRSLTLAALIAFTLQASGGFDDIAARAAAALQRKDAKTAASLYQQAVALKPSWAEGWFYLGASFYDLHEYPEARKAFERASVLAPNKGAVWGFLGLSEYQMADYARALADFKKGERLGLPDNLEFVSSVHNCAAIVYLRMHDYSAAVEQLRPLARLGDQSPATIETFGVSVLGLPYLPMDVPASKQGLVQLAGRAEWAMSAERDAASIFQQLLSSYPNEPGVHYLHGIYLLDHDPQAARSEFEKELQIRSSHVPARLQIAILDIRAGEPAKAVPLAGAALKLEPRNALAHAILARAYMDLNEFAKAVPELQRSASLAPENPQLHLYLEQAYRHLGRTAEAEKEMAEFLRLKKASGAADGSNF